MNNQSKAYAILLYMLLPFSAIIVGLRSFDSNFGKRLLIALYAFLGFTAFSVGDLERYESEFYKYKTATFSEIFVELISLQTGKFYNSFISVLSGSIFDSHHYYFLILFVIYGYFYLNIIHLLKEIKLQNLNYFELLFFFGMFLFLMIRTIPNLAFYTGGVFILFMVISYIKKNDSKYLFFLFLTPLFHIGLSIYLAIPLLLFAFKKKTWLYASFVLLSLAIGKSSFVSTIETIANKNENTIIDSKYKSYASEKGQESLEKRYEENANNNNLKLQSLVYIQDAIWYYFVPVGVMIIYFRRKILLVEDSQRRLLNVVLLFWGLSNLMLNVSQGLRFLVLFCFLAIGLFFDTFIKNKNADNDILFNLFIKLFVPVLFIFGLMSTYASNEMFIAPFFISNFFIEIKNYSF